MRYYIALIISLALSTSAISQEDDGLSQFLVGTYDVVGRLPDSQATYTGVMSLTTAEQGFKVIKKVADSTTVGTAQLEEALAGEAKVLRIRFQEQGKAYESTCLIGSDLDNYARLTCQYYLTNGTTQQAGLEALFIQATGL
jgi:hypothetical protein